jgi:integrase
VVRRPARAEPDLRPAARRACIRGEGADAQADDGLAELDAGTETLAAFAEEWWEIYARANLERNTLRNYAQLWNKHALPRLGEYRLRDLTARTVADFRVELERAGVGPAAVRKTLAVLQSMLQRAVEWEQIRSNPVRVVRKPAARRKRAVRASPPEEVERLRAGLLSDDRLRDATLVSVLVYAGLRPQELLALQWWHIRDRTILVEQAASDGVLKGQKTERPAPDSRPAHPTRRRPGGVAPRVRAHGRRGLRLRAVRRRDLARGRLAQLAQTRLQTRCQGDRHPLPGWAYVWVLPGARRPPTRCARRTGARTGWADARSATGGHPRNPGMARR